MMKTILSKLKPHQFWKSSRGLKRQKRREDSKENTSSLNPKNPEREREKLELTPGMMKIFQKDGMGVIKNISGIPVTKYEESLFLKGKKFCPVKKDPPVLRMQRELNQFYRNLRIEWFFYGQRDGRSEVEKRFYLKSQIWA
jgi:hypothetical protein